MNKFRRSIAVLASVLGVGAVLADGATAAARTTVHVRNTLIGAQIGGGETSMRSAVPGEEQRSSSSSRTRRATAVPIHRPRTSALEPSLRSVSTPSAPATMDSSAFIAMGRYVRGAGLVQACQRQVHGFGHARSQDRAPEGRDRRHPDLLTTGLGAMNVGRSEARARRARSNPRAGAPGRRLAGVVADSGPLAALVRAAPEQVRELPLLGAR